jgi:hypothetical protein
MGYRDIAKFSDIVGKTITSIEGGVGDDVLTFHTDDCYYVMNHHQDCCENVHVEDITGYLLDLIGTPILMVEEAVSEENPAGVEIKYQDSFTWTFYKLATIKGYVDIRWYGESNGYYSESVSFEKYLKEPK